MGGPELDSSANLVLNNLQKKLNAVLDKLSGQFVASLVPNIHEQMNRLGVILTKIKGPQLQKSQLVGVLSSKLPHSFHESNHDARIKQMLGGL